MPRSKLTRDEARSVDECVLHFEEHEPLFDGFARGLHDSLKHDEELSPFVHFIKYRVKSSERLRQKLEKKLLAEARGAEPEITVDNLFQKINDLAGVRILHLHTSQIEQMIPIIKRVIRDQKYTISEGPIANCWDVEYESFFRSLGVETKSRESMYTSLHFIISANERTKITFELQVRTLLEEVWGEISHRVGYEDEEPFPDVVRQLKILARVTSGSTRLVDCIFDTYNNLLPDSDGQKS